MNAKENERLCKTTEQALRHGTGELGNIPGLIRKIIKTKAWEKREVRPGVVVELHNLIDLITSKFPNGWGEDPKKIEAVIKDDAEVLEMWREATHESHGGDRRSENTKCNNVTDDTAVTGNTRSYTLSRLKREQPELFQRVVDKELSANAAAIEAGFRVKMISVPLDVEKAARAMIKHFGEHEIIVAIENAARIDAARCERTAQSTLTSV